MNFIGRGDNLVSIVLPVYNAANTVVTAIESVIKQSYQLWELIIVDDGSIDDSVNVVQAYIETLNDGIRSQILFIRKQNEGPSKTRNLAIENARGNIIAFLDSDDMWIPEKLEIQLSYFTDDIGIISGGFNKTLFSGQEAFHYVSFSDLLKRNYFSTPTVMISRDKIGVHRFSEFQKYAEDYKLWLDITARYPGLYINKTIAKSITGKFDFGITGLSSNLLEMEKGEISNYHDLLKEGKISLLRYSICITYSLLKFIRRLVIIKFKLYEK